MQCVPFELTALDAYPTRQSWDAVAVELVGTMLDRWHLTARDPFVGGEAGSVLRVDTADGSPAVLKVGYPHFEGEWEAVGLETWGPERAPLVLRQDPWTWSMLLELVDPGTPLSRTALPAEEALAIGGALHVELRSAEIPAGVPSLASVLDAYAKEARAQLAGQAASLDALGVRVLIETGIESLAGLADSASDRVLLHGDLNPGNILQSAEGWRVIDPKPMHGDPAFDLWPLLEQLGSPWTQPSPVRYLRDHLDYLAQVAECDPERTARWAYARTVLNVSWYLADGNETATKDAVRELLAWGEVIDS